MGIYQKKIYSNSLSKFTEICDSCKSEGKMQSTGNAYQRSFGDKHWVLEFKCNDCHELSNIFSKEYENFILQVIKNEDLQIEDL